MLQVLHKNQENQGMAKQRHHPNTPHHLLHLQIYALQGVALVPHFGLMFIFSLIRHVQKHNQLQTLADAALQSYTDQDLEHKYEDKVCTLSCMYDGFFWYVCWFLASIYVCVYVCECIPLLGEYTCSFCITSKH